MNISEVNSSLVTADTVSTNNVDILVGSVYYFVTMNQPDGWLFCNGSAVSRTTYAELFSAIGTSFGAGNGSTTFNLPDFRGTFLRCANLGDTTYDKDSGGSRGIGSYQDYAMRQLYGHTQSYQCDYQRTGERSYGVFRDSQYGGGTDDDNGRDACSKCYMDSNRQSNGSGHECRPVNVTLAACIKY